MKPKIVVGIDPSEASHHAVRWAAEFARLFDAEVHAVHVMSSAGQWQLDAFQVDTDRVRDERDEVAHESWTEPLRETGTAHKVSVVVGDAADSLLDIARADDAVLVAVGASSRGAVGEALLGSVSRALVDKGERPIAVIPAN